MNPAVVLLANHSFPFSLYDFHLNGVSPRELADAYQLPLAWVEERLEAVRLCLKYQVHVSVAAPNQPEPPPEPTAPKKKRSRPMPVESFAQRSPACRMIVRSASPNRRTQTQSRLAA